MKKIYLLLLTVLFAATTSAQLTGTLNIPGAYPNLGAAITDLNTQGVGAGGVTLNLLAGNPQTAPAGGYSVTATGILANQITIQGNGNIITASAALTAGNLNDAIFKLIGSDYVILSGFNMQENAANTTTAAATNNMTEWGVALLYASLTDGAQNNTIQGNTIALNRTYANTFGIYSNVRHSATDVITLADITNNTTAPNSNNKFYANNISNVNQGFVLIGSATAANMDNNNDIGGASLATGNNVTNYGGLGAATAYQGFPTGIIDGAYLNDQINFNLSFNSFISASLNTAVALRGILTDYLVPPPSPVTDNVNNNTVTFTQAGTGGMQCITTAGVASTNVTMNMTGNRAINNAVTGVGSAVTIFGVANLGVFGTLNMNNNVVSGNTSTATTGGFVGATNQGAVTGTINILNNDIGTEASGAVTFANATSGGITGISNTTGAATTTLNINGNTFRGFSLVSSGQMAMVINSGAIGVAINMNNNRIGTATANSLSYSAASAGNFFGIVNAAGAATAALSISGNDITRIVQNVTGSGGLNYINNQVFTGATAINNNTFTNLTANSTAGTVLISNNVTHAANTAHTCNNNSIVTGFNRISNSGALQFFITNSTSPATVTETSTGNNFSNVTIAGTSTIAGWQSSDGGSPVANVTNNTFSNISSTGTGAITVLNVGFSGNGTVTGNTISNVTGGGAIIGILSASGTQNFSGNTISGLSSTGASAVTAFSLTGGTTQTVSKTKIYNIQSGNAGGTVNGILVSAGTTVNLVNNLIGDLRAPLTSSTTDAVRGISLTSTTGTSNINVYNNTIYLNAASSGANFATSGLFHTTSTTATTAQLTMRNNIIYNNSFANGTGIVAAFKRSSGAANTLNNYNAASNNNLLFAGTPSANRLIYYDGTSSAQTLAAYQAGVFTAGTIAPRDAASRTELSTPFLSTAGASATFLHIDPAVQTVAESGGANIAGVIDDYDGDVRNAVTPDMGADEFTGLTVTACAGTPVAGAITGTNNICQGQFAILTLSGYSANSGISIQWQSSAVSGGPYAPIAGETGATYNTGVILTGTTVYYVATVTCSNGGGNATTVQFAVTSNAAPTVTVNPPAPTICTGGAGVALTASGALTYTWTPAAGLSATTGATVTANPTVTTTYTVTGTNAAGCTNTATVTVTVNQSPSISTTTATPAALCLGSTSQLQVTILAPTFCASTHSNGCGLGDEITNVVLGSISNPSGCAATAYTYFPPSANTTTTLAVGTPYTVTLSFGTDGNQYFGAWIDYNHDGTFSAAEFLGASTNAGASGTVSVIFTVPAGAFNGTARLRLVGGNDSPPTSAQGCGASSSTFGETEDYDVIITGGVNEFTYAWTPAATLNNSTIANPVATPTGTTTYSVVVTAVNGCTATGNATVTVGTPVVSEVLVQPTTCVTTDGSITLTVSGGTGGVGPYSYAWIGPGVNPTSQNQVNLGVGSYTVTVTDIPSGCTNILTYALPGPGGCNICPTIPTLTTNPTPAVCQNANVVLTASGLTNMGVTYGITFKYSLVALADPYVGGTVITTVPNGSLTTGGTVATTTTTFAATGNYFIYAILSPLPVDPGCRPFATTNLTVNSLPTVNAVPNQALCRGATTTAITFSGSPVGTVFNWTNNTPAIGLAASGSGNIAPFVATNNTALPLVATITVTPTFTGGGTTCSGAPTTFTITVNPNLALIIVAVPGTTLCQGDPAALTVFESAGSVPASVNHSSTNTITALNSVSCGTAITTAVNSFWRVYDLATFPAITGNFTINTVTFGVELSSGGPQNVTVNLYTQAGGAFPGGTRTLIGSQVFSVPNLASALYTATLAAPVTVSNGAVIVVEAMTAGAVNTRFFLGSNAAAETGPTYLSAAACAINVPTTTTAIGFPNMHGILFLSGTVPGVGGIATGTFLWSPAAGLNSTTTNPVAASPAVTTTYTVVRTTPAGCVGSANITLTVNQRPTITSHPANVTVCATSIATFTVTGTGTGITYQWQEAVGAGPFVNLGASAPYTGVNTPTLTINPVTAIMNGNRYRCVLGGTCPPAGTANISNPATLTVNGLPVVTITPAGPVCGGIAGINGTLLSTASAAPPIPGSVTVNSGTINLAVPDNTANGVSNNITVAGIPANATITNVSVTLNNFSHTYPGDIIMHLRAPNNAILNLYKYGTGLFTGPVSGVPTWGWYGSTVSQLGTVAWSTVAAAPFIYNNSTPWRADAINTPVAGAVIQNPTGFVSTANSFTDLYTTGPSVNGVWTLAMCDGGPGDVGTLASWSIKVDYTTPGGTGSPLTFTWSPATGLYTNPTATTPYIAGTQTPQVYAAPTVNTVYTATGTDGTTGCSNTATVTVIYTPVAPIVSPAAVSMCLGDAAVPLTITSSLAPVTTPFCSGTINLAVPDNTANGVNNTINVTGIPAGATISNVSVTLNMSHTYPGDAIIHLRAPNGQILNLYKYGTGQFTGASSGPATWGWYGATVGQLGTVAWSTVAVAPFIYNSTTPWRADAINTPVAGAVIQNPTGFVSNATSFANLYTTAASTNGAWTLALADGGPGDVGTLASWCINITYGVPSSGVWTPNGPTGTLYTDPAATIFYTGTPANVVYAKPLATTTYSVTVASVGPNALQSFANPAPVTVTNGGSTPYPSNITVSGLPITGVSVQSVTLSNLSHTWSDDIDILLQSPTGQNVILMSDVGGASIITNATYVFNDAGLAMGTGANPGGTYRPTNLVGTLGVEPDNWPAPGPGSVTQVAPALALFGSTANVNGVWKLFVVDDFAGDDGTIAGGYSINFSYPTPGCTSPPRTVTVTVNTPVAVISQPVNATVCTDKVASFTVAVTGTSPTFQWQESTDNGNTFTIIVNGGVYSGATTATLVITAPPVSMNNYQYRVIVNGAVPCGSATSFKAILAVNPLPTIVISASPYTRLLPGLFTTLSSVVTPVAAATTGGYTWLRNGVQVPGSTGTLTVGIDALGDYSLRVTDINGCTNTSNVITISDSVSGKCFIYPNPNSGMFQVRFFSAANNVLPRGIAVYDGKGEKVLTQSYIIGRPYDRMDVDLRRNGKGLYWVEIVDTNGHRIAMCRVVIQ